MKRRTMEFFVVSFVWLIVSLLYFLYMKNIGMGIGCLCSGTACLAAALIRRNKEIKKAKEKEHTDKV